MFMEYKSVGIEGGQSKACISNGQQKDRPSAILFEEIPQLCDYLGEGT